MIYGVGNMLGAGIYGLIGKGAGLMGNALWMAFVTAMVAAGLTGLSYASLGSRHPRAAGAAFIAHRATGWSALSYLVGLAVMASGLTSMATASQVFARYLGEVTPAIPATAIIVTLLVVLGAVNFWGIRQSAWLNALCTTIETAGLLFIIAVGMKYWGNVNLLDATTAANPTGDLSLALLLGGAALTFFSFIGFEDLLNVSEEVKNPRRTFPLALLGALVITTFIYLGVSVTAVSVVNPAELAESKGPLVAVAREAAPWFPASLFSLIALFAVTNTALLNYIMGSRLAYGMARQGLLPALLGRLHPRTSTPHVAIAMLGLIVGTLALTGDLRTLAQATGTLLLFSFTIVNVSLVILQRRREEPRGGFEVPAFVPIGGALVCVALIAHQPVQALQLAGAIVAGIVVLYLVLRPRALPET